MERLSAALDELYGGAVEPIVRKKGETQCVGFVASFLDDAYVPDGTPILERAAALLGELLLTPARENGGFVSAYVERERSTWWTASGPRSTTSGSTPCSGWCS